MDPTVASNKLHLAPHEGASILFLLKRGVGVCPFAYLASIHVVLEARRSY